MLETNPNAIPFKSVESHRGYLVYVTRSYPATVPYLKGIHLTLDGWREGRDDEGWGVQQAVMEKLQEREPAASGREQSEKAGAPTMVKAVPQLQDDMDALAQLFQSETPVKRRARPSNTAIGIYGFGDASGLGFGSTLQTKDGTLHYRLGEWSREISEESSNFRELFNLILAIE